MINRTHKSYRYRFRSSPIPCLEFSIPNIQGLFVISRVRNTKIQKDLKSQANKEPALCSEWEKFNHATRYRAIMPYKSPSRNVHHRVTRYQAYTHVLYSPRESGVANERCFARAARAETEEERTRIQRRKERGSPGVRINDVSRERV